MKPRVAFRLGLIVLVALVAAGCVPVPASQSAPATAPSATPAPAAQTPTQSVALANPASQNCVAQGGKLEIEERGDGGQIGVCYFEDNRQCEEWALLRGECPVGGVKVTGYAAAAGRYCAITGGAYTVTGKSGAADEQGECVLPGGVKCDAWDYYNGKCDASTMNSSRIRG